MSMTKRKKEFMELEVSVSSLGCANIAHGIRKLQCKLMAVTFSVGTCPGNTSEENQKHAQMFPLTAGDRQVSHRYRDFSKYFVFLKYIVISL